MTTIVRVITHRPDMDVPPPLPPTISPPRESASIWTKAKRLRIELLNARRAGWKITPRAVRQARLTICQACEYNDAKGNFGLGECHAPGCGCTRLKLWIATARCPLPQPRWHAKDEIAKTAGRE